jgi:hypothetical protein
MIRRSLISLASIAVLVFLAGCGNSDGSGKGGGAPIGNGQVEKSPKAPPVPPPPPRPGQ